MGATRQYELVYILTPDVVEAQSGEIHTLVEHVVAQFGGAIAKTDVWGRRKLAYPIKRHKDGFYVVHTINGPGDMVKELDRRLKVADLVVRHLVVRVDEDLKTSARARTRRETTTARRRAARGLSPRSEPRPVEDDDTRDAGMDGMEV